MGEKEKETTLDMDQVMKEGMEKFQGELDEAARETEDITPLKTDEKSPPDEKKVEGEEKAEDKTEDKTEDKKEEEAEVKPGEKDEKETKAEDKAGTLVEDLSAGSVAEQEAEAERLKAEAKKLKETQLRFKTHEDAEEGYRHIQGAKTKVEEENAKLKKELAGSRKQQQEKEKQAKDDTTLLDYAAEAHEEALNKIDELDPDNKEYRKKVARIWAEKDRSIDIKRRELSASDGKVEGKQAEEKEGKTDTKAEDDTKALQDDVWEFVSNQARESGIDPKDELFQMASALAPTQDIEGNDIPFKNQVAWAIDRTKKYIEKQEERLQGRLKVEADKKSKEYQDENLPLGKSPADRSAIKGKEAPAIVTLNDAVEGAFEERRL